MTWVFLYLVGGLFWAAYNLYGLPFSHKVRERYAECWRAGGRTRAIWAAGFLLGYLTWIVFFVWSIMPNSWTPRATAWLARAYRREYLDRDGLLKPQMPASRCPEHGSMDLLRVTCRGCQTAWQVSHCKECCAEEIAEQHCEDCGGEVSCPLEQGFTDTCSRCPGQSGRPLRSMQAGDPPPDGFAS